MSETSNSPPTKSKTPRSLAVLGLVCGLLLVPVVAKQFLFKESASQTPPPPDISATYVAGPVDAEGYIRYEEALNQQLSEGITAKTNANVAILQALGPHPEGATMPSAYFNALGIDPPPEEGDYFLDISQYLATLGKLPPYEMERMLKQNEIAIDHPWSAEEFPKFASWLQTIDKPLNLLQKGMQKPHYYNPLYSPEGTLLSALLPTAQRCRALATALCTRAMLRLNQGDDEGAWADILTCHRLGRHVSHGGCLIELLVGIAIDHLATNAAQQFAQADVTLETLQAAQADLQQLPPLNSLHNVMNIGERFMALDTLQGLHRGRLNAKAIGLESIRDTQDFDLVGVMRLINQWLDQTVELTDNDLANVPYVDVEATTKMLEAIVPKYSETTALGRTFLDPQEQTQEFAVWFHQRNNAVLHKLLTASVRAEARSRIEQLVFALAIHHKENDHYPETLDKLMPPADELLLMNCFTGKPLIYHRNGEGYLLVGVNPTHNIPKISSSDSPFNVKEDVVVRVPIPDPETE